MCFAEVVSNDRGMADDAPRIVSASREIAAAPEQIFELIADPALQPSWDGNANLVEADPGQRVREVGDVFRMVVHTGTTRENTIVEFEEGRLIAWRPNEPGKQPPGHLWRWQLEVRPSGATVVTHTYDWSRLTDTNRLPRARNTGEAQLMASIDRLAQIAEQPKA
jgi:uncharacterized protein YndB with AHSA1/START domain